MMLPNKTKGFQRSAFEPSCLQEPFWCQSTRTQSDDAYRGCVSWTYTQKNVSKDRPFIFDIERSSYRRKTRHVVNGCLPRLTYNEITCCWPAMHLWHLACCFLSTWSLAYVCIQRYRVVVTADFFHICCVCYFEMGVPLNQQFNAMPFSTSGSMGGFHQNTKKSSRFKNRVLGVYNQPFGWGYNGMQLID